MDQEYYYIQLINGKYRICKDYIFRIQDNSDTKTYYIEFCNGEIRTNNEVFRARRKARQARDYANYKLRKFPFKYSNLYIANDKIYGPNYDLSPLERVDVTYANKNF